MKLKTSELTGAALDWAVAKSLDSTFNEPLTDDERYSTDWAQGGPIIEREGIDIINAANVGHDEKWMAAWPIRFGNRSDFLMGPTPLVAAMRCYVASKLGAEVEVPEGLA